MSQPTPPPPPPTPKWPAVPTTPPVNPPTIPPAPRYVACCELAQFGDECDCAAFFAEVAAAFAPRDLSLGRLGPIYDTRIGATR